MNLILKFIAFYILSFFLLPNYNYSQEDEMFLALGAHIGVMPNKTREEDGFERNSALFTEFELAFNFNKHLAISFNYGFASTQTKDNRDTKFYEENIRGIALGLKYSPLKTRFKIFCEGQFIFFGSVSPEKPKEAEWNMGAFGAGVNLGIGAKYMIIKELDAFLKTKYNRFFYTITIGMNFNLPPPKTK